MRTAAGSVDLLIHGSMSDATIGAIELEVDDGRSVTPAAA
jgi:hypothetical protein